MRCPKCKLENPDSALRCDCGYDFETKEMKNSYLDTGHEKKADKGLLTIGWISAIFGGYIGVMISYYIAFSKNDYGYRYDMESRKTGKAIFKLSILMICIVAILQFIVLLIKCEIINV